MTYGQEKKTPSNAPKKAVKPATKTAPKAKPDEDDEDDVRPTGNNSQSALKGFVERVERLEEEKKATAEDIRDVYSEAKGAGFEPKIMRKVVRLRKMNAEKRREEQELVELYCSAIGLA